MAVFMCVSYKYIKHRDTSFEFSSILSTVDLSKHLQRLPVTRALRRFFPSFGGRQSNVSMTMVVFISCQFHGDVRSSLDQV